MSRFEFRIRALVIIFLGFPCGLTAYDEYIQNSPVDIKYAPERVNERKVDDIFNLLADIDPKTERRFRSETEHQNVEQNLVRKQITDAIKPPMNKSNPSTLKRYLEILNTISKTSLIKSKTVENVLNTVNKVTRIYEGEKKRLSDKIDNEIEQGTRSPKQNSSTDGVMKSTAKIAQYLLEPPNMKKVFEISSRAKDEDEILEQLTSVILGAEERSGGGYGSGLTLDPVTCIALLTLAAYLIRAVFQILTLDAGRQFHDSSWGSFNLFEGGAKILTLLDEGFPPSVVRAKRNTQETNKIKDSWLEGTSALALFLKINMDNQYSCLDKVICSQVSGKSLKDFGVSEAFWSATGIYKEGLHKWLDYFSSNYGQNFCENASDSFCPENAQEPYSCPPCSPAKLKHYIQWQNWMVGFLKGVSRIAFIQSLF